MSSLYILEIRPLSEVSLANMFSHIVGSFFILMLFSLAMYTATFLLDSYVHSQRDNTMFSQRPKTHIANASTVSLCVSHLGELLEDSGSRKKKLSPSF